MFGNADFIHRYTRGDTIRDGVRTDVTATAREGSFNSTG